MLAVLKTGRGLPGDRPRAARTRRIAFMLTDAAPIAAITTAALAERLDGHDLAIIDIDDPAIDTSPAPPLPAPAPGRHRLPDLHLGHHR